MECVLATAVPENWDDPIFTRAQAVALLATPHHYLFLTNERGGEGHILLQAMPQMQADILTLYVPPAFRRQGLARRLVQVSLEKARELGCEGLTLEVDSTNESAIKLYAACGLQHVGTRAGYYQNPVSNTKADALVMAVSLT